MEAFVLLKLEFHNLFTKKLFQNKKIFEHIEMVLPFAKSIGIDIDSYNIATMQNLVPLEKKSALQLQEIQKFLNSKNIPFVLKGIFDKDGIELVKQVKPDAAYISNHGGRIHTQKFHLFVLQKTFLLSLLVLTTTSIVLD